MKPRGGTIEKMREARGTTEPGAGRRRRLRAMAPILSEAIGRGDGNSSLRRPESGNSVLDVGSIDEKSRSMSCRPSLWPRSQAYLKWAAEALR